MKQFAPEDHEIPVFEDIPDNVQETIKQLPGKTYSVIDIPEEDI